MNSSAQIDGFTVVNPLEQDALRLVVRHRLNAASPNRDRHFFTWGKWTRVIDEGTQGQHTALA